MSKPPRHRSFALAVTALLTGAALAPFGLRALAQGTPKVARATLRDAGGREVGSATFTDLGGGRTRIDLRVSGLPQGAHGVHVHVGGACAPGADPATGGVVPFGAAGEHFDPLDTRNHGGPQNSPQMAHAGDIPNIVVGADGAGKLSFESGKLSVTGDRLAVDGRAILVHEKADDYMTDPSGDSGGRIACGVIQLNGSNLKARYVIPGPTVFPEGLAYDPQQNAAYTASTTNGDLWRVDLGTGKASPLQIGGAVGRQTATGMRLDPHRRLIIAGGASGMIAVVNLERGTTEAVLKTPPSPQSFLNDVTIAPDGSVYITDSLRPVLFRARTSASGVGHLTAWLDLSRTPIKYEAGLNLNGIVSTPDGRYLLTVQTNTGQLWRIDTRTKAAREIDLGGARLTSGDGIVLAGQTLHVIRNALGRIDVVTLAADFASGKVTRSTTDPALRFPTSGALTPNGLLVVNGQLDKQKNPPPVLPFTLVDLPVP